MDQPKSFQKEVRLGMAVLVLLVLGLGAAAYHRVMRVSTVQAGREAAKQAPLTRPPETAESPRLLAMPDNMTFREAAAREQEDDGTAAQLPSPLLTVQPSAPPPVPQSASALTPNNFAANPYAVQPAASVEPPGGQFQAAPANFAEVEPAAPQGGAFSPAVAASPAAPAMRPEQRPQPSPLRLASAEEPASSIPPATTLPNDSFWMISERAYGTGVYFKALYQHNRERFPNPDRLPAGAPLDIPSLAELEQLYPELCPETSTKPSAESAEPKPTAAPYRRRLYSVRMGDTLFEIARRELGDGRRWTDIYRLNQSRLGDRYDNLPADMQLLLPE